MSIRSIAPILIALSLGPRGVVSAQSASSPRVASTSDVVLDGAGFSHQRVTLGTATANWFATNDDAHALVELRGASPTPVVISVQWDGKSAAHVINHETNSRSDPASPTF